MSSGVTLAREGGAALVTIDRPEARNAVDRATMAALEEVVTTLERDESVAATILTGGGGFFVSGGDLKDLAEILDREEGRAMSLWMQSILGRLEALPGPVIAALDGDALGGGCEIALACDVRVIVRRARFRFRQNAMGLTPGWGGGQRLARLVGRGRALLLFATAADVGAEEALAMGLADRVAERSALDEAKALAHAIAQQPAHAVRSTKRALLRGAEMPHRAAIDFEAELFAQTWGSPEHRAALEAFLRRPR